jgi:FeS assembly protein IscX
MNRKLKWTDSEDIGILLHEQRPEIDPLSVRFTDLHQWVCALPEFGDDAKSSNEAKLEAIQMAWLEEYREAQDE